MKSNIDGLLKNWDPIRTELGPTVQYLSIYLKIYKEYSNNFQRADAVVQQLKKHSKFKKLVHVDYIEDYLIKPVQRPLQYKLFITDYLKALPKDHIDQPRLSQALKALLKIADEINEFVEGQIRQQKMIQLEKTFGDIVESTRHYKS